MIVNIVVTFLKNLLDIFINTYYPIDLHCQSLFPVAHRGRERDTLMSPQSTFSLLLDSWEDSTATRQRPQPLLQLNESYRQTKAGQITSRTITFGEIVFGNLILASISSTLLVSLGVTKDTIIVITVPIQYTTTIHIRLNRGALAVRFFDGGRGTSVEKNTEEWVVSERDSGASQIEFSA